ncbi:hypothetical protein EYF80_029932 [Liparis tanakae]|uniref:Uncharacterized protein n=1 Tax=Liparis tanakae TaxID=230148 RepID=A0A4Z2H467_9TELE|nr:hypothetical protein EYF80_029932 [Liparis tanakae]
MKRKETTNNYISILEQTLAVRRTPPGTRHCLNALKSHPEPQLGRSLPGHAHRGTVSASPRTPGATSPLRRAGQEAVKGVGCSINSKDQTDGRPMNTSEHRKHSFRDRRSRKLSSELLARTLRAIRLTDKDKKEMAGQEAVKGVGCSINSKGLGPTAQWQRTFLRGPPRRKEGCCM